VPKIRATDGTWDAVQNSKIFYREMNADDVGFYRHDVCWNFHQSSHHICSVLDISCSPLGWARDLDHVPFSR